MFQFLIGLLNVLFFGGGLLLLYLKDRGKLDWKSTSTFLIFIVGGLFLMINSDFTSGKTVVMETGNEIFDKNDTVIAGNYEYAITKIGTENSLDDYGTKKNASGKYLIFKIEITNKSSYPFSMETVVNPPFFLVNQERYYEVNRDLSRSVTDLETGEFGYWSRNNAINPGNKSIGYAVFDIPKEIINSDQTQLLILTDDSAPNDIYLNIN